MAAKKSKKAHNNKFDSLDRGTIKDYLEIGYTDKQIADLMGIGVSTLNRYKKDYPTWWESLKGMRGVADGKVEISLFKRATGYTAPDIHVSNHRGETKVTPILKHYPPDPTSMIFWLKNRKKEQWRDKQEVEHSGNLSITETALKAWENRAKKIKDGE